jgi:sigma-B regulation protein RsbU (phosphoserine phosphatase)
MFVKRVPIFKLWGVIRTNGAYAMVIGNACVKSSVDAAIAARELTQPAVRFLLERALRRLSRSLCIDQIMLFVRGGDTFEFVSSASAGLACGRCFVAGGFIERVLGKTAGLLPIEWNGENARILGESLQPEDSRVLADLEAGFLLGIRGAGRVDGFLCIGKGNGGGFLGGGDVRLVCTIAEEAALVLENCRLNAALAAGHAELQQRDWEVEIAREVQQRIFPAKRPRIRGLDYYSDWRPARSLSGDYLDHFEMPDGNLGILIGDVAGKGVAAALLTSSLHSMMKALRGSGAWNVPELVTAVDELFYEICPDRSYASLFAARYDPSRGVLHYVNAGHEPPVVLRKTAAGYRPVMLEATGRSLACCAIRRTTKRSYRSVPETCWQPTLTVCAKSPMPEARSGDSGAFSRPLRRPGTVKPATSWTAFWSPRKCSRGTIPNTTMRLYG